MWERGPVSGTMSLQFASKGRVSDARASVVPAVSGIATGFESILVWMNGMMGKLQEGLPAPIRTSNLATCEEIINFLVADTTSVCAGASDAAGSRYLPTRKVASQGARSIFISMLFRPIPFHFPQKPAV